MPGDGRRRFDLAGDPLRQRLQSDQLQVCVERALHGTERAQVFDADAPDERFGAKRPGEAAPVAVDVGDDLLRPRELQETAVRPVEPSGVDDHAADGVAMPGDALGGRMHNDVGAEFDRAQQVRRRHGVVENQRQPVPVRQIGQRTDIGDGGVRVGDRLGEDGTGRGTDQRLDLMQVVDVLDEISVDAELRQEVAERID